MLTTPTSTKDKLVRAALEIGAQDGLESATTAAIATRAGVAEGTLYRHFPTRAPGAVRPPHGWWV